MGYQLGVIKTSVGGVTFNKMAQNLVFAAHAFSFCKISAKIKILFSTNTSFAVMAMMNKKKTRDLALKAKSFTSAMHYRGWHVQWGVAHLVEGGLHIQWRGGTFGGRWGWHIPGG